MTINKFAGALLVAAAATVLAPPSSAEEFAQKIPDRIWLDVGGAINDLNTDVSITGSSGAGATIDFEEIFDLPGSKTTFQIQGTVRISEKRRWIDFGYVDINRAGGRVIQNDITWGDYTYAAGGQVDAHFDTRFVYAAFRYDFLHEEKIRISGSAGLSWTDLGSGLSGSGTYTPPSGPPVAGTYSVDESIAAPVPLIGLNLDWALAKGLVLRSYNRVFRLNVSDIDGGMYENGLHLNWYFVKNVGLGLGYDRIEVKINEYTTDEGDIGKFDYAISSLGLYLTLAF
jgi:hypothetical protein